MVTARIANYLNAGHICMLIKNGFLLGVLGARRSSPQQDLLRAANRWADLQIGWRSLASQWLCGTYIPSGGKSELCGYFLVLWVQSTKRPVLMSMIAPELIF
jgi:hypothetical protein